MTDKQRYDLEPLLFALGILKEFDALDINKLQFYCNGVSVDIPEGSLEEWRYVGLSNTSYVKMVLLPNEKIQ